LKESFFALYEEVDVGQSSCGSDGVRSHNPCR
jgi:hypothetical protein